MQYLIEIRSSGTGGLEKASLFASNLYKMYEKVNKKKWIIEVISISKNDMEGWKIIALIKGKNVYSSLKYESRYEVQSSDTERHHR